MLDSVYDILNPESKPSGDLTVHDPLENTHVAIQSSPTPESSQVKDSVSSAMDNYFAKPDKEASFGAYSFDWNKSGVQKEVNSPYYNTLGADPREQDINELKYENLQTGWDESTRGVGGLIAGIGHGFVDQATSFSNFVSFLKDPTLRDAFQRDQLEEINRKQQEFDNNWHIFQGGDPTYYSRFMKGVQSAGPLLGSLGELYAETFVVNAGIAATFGALAPLEGIESLRWAQFGAEGIGTAERGAEIASNSAKIADALTTDSMIGNLWKGLGEKAASAATYVPAIGNTLGYAGELGAYGMERGVMATIGRGVGAMAADIRGINLATSFASGNAAATYQQMVNNQTEKFKKDNGGAEPDFAQLEDIKDKATKAAKVDGAINAWGMLMMEKMAFKNILGSRATTQELLEKSGQNIFDRVGIKPQGIEGALEEPLYLKQQAKWYNFKANYWEGGRSVLEHGASFGVTMNAMGAIDKGVKSYFDAKYDNQDVSVFDSIRDGIDSQFSKEGASTFISGFLNGALLMGIGGAAFKQVGKWGERKLSSMSESEYQQKTATDAIQSQEFVDKVNKLWQDPFNPVKDILHDLVNQNAFNSAGSSSLAGGDRKAYHDIADDASREFLMKMIKNNLADMWIKRLESYSNNMSPEDLCKMMNLENTPENYQQLKNQIAELPGRAKDLKRIAREVDGKLGNPFNPYATDPVTGKRIFEDGSKEFNIEANNARIHQMSKDYMVIMKDSAERAQIRQNNLLNGYKGSTGILDMPFAKNLDFSSVFTASSPQLLEKEIASHDQILSIDPTDKTAIAAKKVTVEYYTALKEYLDGYADILNEGATPDRAKKLKELNDKHIDNLTEKFHKHLENSLQTRNQKGKVTDRRDPPAINEVRDGMSKMMDYYQLGVDNGRALHMLNVVTDPSIIRKFQMSFATEGAKRQEEATQTKTGTKTADEQQQEKTTVDENGKKVNDNATVNDIKGLLEQKERAEMALNLIQKNYALDNEKFAEGLANAKKHLADIKQKLEEKGYKEPVKTEHEDAEVIPDDEHTETPPDNKEVLKANMEKSESLLLDYLKKQPEGKSLNTSNMAFDGIMEETALIQKLEAANRLFTGAERIKELTTIVQGYYDNQIGRIVDKKHYPELSGNPRVIERGPRNFGIQVGDKELGDNYKQFTSLREANSALDKYIAEHNKPVEGTDFKIGQHIYDGSDGYQLMEKRGELLLRSYITRDEKTNVDKYHIGKDIPVTKDELNERFSATKRESPVVTTAKTPFDSTQPKSSDPYATINIAIPKEDGPTSQVTEEDKKAFIANVIDIPKEQLGTGKGLSVQVQKNKKVSGDIKPIPGNSQIVQKGQQYSIALKSGDKVIGYVTNPSPQVYQAPDGTTKTISQMSVQDIAALYKPTPQFPTADMWLAHLQKTDADSQYLSDLIQEALKNGSTADIENKISLNTHYDYDFIKTEETGATFGELDHLYRDDNGQLKYIVFNNSDGESVEARGVSEQEEAIAKSINPAGLSSMYTAIVWLKNGDHIPVQLTPRQIGQQELVELTNAISGIDTKEKLDEANKQLKQLFITLPVHSVEGTENKGVSVNVRSVGIGEDNHLFISVRQQIPGYAPIPLGAGNIYAAKGSLFTLDNSGELVDKLNKLLQSDAIEADIPVLTENNLKWQPIQGKPEDMEASVKKNLFKGISLTYSAPDSTGKKRVYEDAIAISKETGSEITPSTEEKSPIQIAKEKKAQQAKLKKEKGKSDPVFKLLSEPFTEQSIENIDTFNQYVRDNSPADSIIVDELDHVTANLKSNGVVMGQFFTYLDTLGNIKGKIETSANNIGKYHEFFHAIYRMFTTPEQQKELLHQAKMENAPTQKKLDRFRSSHERYSNMSDEQLRDEYQEEYIADEFDKYASDRSKSKAKGGIKALFDRIMSWVRYIKDLLTNDRIKAMFYKIHTGDYKKARLQDNQFTNNHDFIISEPVPKAISTGLKEITVKLGNGETKTMVIDSYLPREKAAQLTSDITAMTLLEIDHSKKADLNKAVDAILDRYKETYDPERQYNVDTFKSITNKLQQKEWGTRLVDMHDIFDDEQSRADLKSNVMDNLRIQGVKDAEAGEEFEDIQEEVGERNADNKFKNNASIGGYESIGRALKTYIASNHIRLIDMDKTDDLGLDTHADGTPMIQAVDTNHIYNGLLKLLSGTPDANEILQRIDTYRNMSNNPDVCKFLDKWLDETGFDMNKFLNTGVKECSTVEGLGLFNGVMKGFMQMRYDYNSVVIDPIDGTTLVVDSNSDSAERVQFRDNANSFYQSYYNHVEDYIRYKQTPKADSYFKEAKEPLDLLAKQVDTIAARSRAITDEDLRVLSEDISAKLDQNLGINLHPNYIKFSIVNAKDSAVRTPMQNSIVQGFHRAVPLDVQAMKTLFIPVLKAHKNPFTRPEGTNETTAAESWLLTTFKNNAIFDSSVYEMSHRNPDGDNIYNFGYSSFNADSVQELNDPAILEAKRDNADTKGSFLLDNPDFLSIDKRLIVAEGLSYRGTYTDADTEETRGIGEANNTGFGDFKSAQYSIFNLATYDISKRKGAYHKKPDGTSFYTYPLSLGNPAEKATHHMVDVPVIHAISRTPGKWSVTDKVKELLYNEVQDELYKIQRVNSEIAEDKQQRIDAGKEWIKGYHDGDTRGLKLWKTAILMDIPYEETTLKEHLEQKALDPEFKLEDIKATIHSAIEKGLKSQVQSYRRKLQNEGLISSEGVPGSMLPGYLTKGLGNNFNDTLNLKAGEFESNLAQVYISNYVNYMGYAHLIYGDESKRCKDFVDMWKRRGGVIAQGNTLTSLASVPDSDMKTVDTIQHVTYPDDEFKTIFGDTKEADDGQMYIPIKTTRAFTIGQGKLNAFKSSILDKLERGRILTKDEQKQMLKTNTFFNSLKPVHNDAYTYLKCSAVNLLREDSSYWTGTEWEPIPGRERLHTLLNKAEQQQANDNIVVLHPISVSKGMKDNIAPSISAIDAKYFRDLNAKDMRLQVENPNKGGDSKGTKSVQPAYQLLGYQNPDTNIHIAGEWKKTSDVQQQYMDSVKQRKINNALSAIKDIYVSDKPITSLEDLDHIVPDMGKFMDKTIDTLMSTGTDSQTLEFYTTKDGVAQYDINLPPLVEKAAQMWLSNMIKGVTKEKVPMWAMTLISDSGFSVIREVTSLDDKGQPKTWNIVPISEFKSNPGKYSSASRYPIDKEGQFTGLSEHIATKEPLYIADTLRDIVPHYDDKGNILFYYTEGLRPYQTADEIDNNQFSDALQFAFGARVPGTGEHSYTHIKWVDNINISHGSSVVISRHVMNRDGHDHDLDKFYVQVYDTYLNKGKRVQYGTEASLEGKYIEYRKWLMANDKQVKKLYHGNKFYSNEEVLATLLSDSTVNEIRLTEVLKELQLPSTVQEFIQGGGEQLNNGYLTNKALQAQIGLLAGEHISGGGLDATINKATSTEGIKQYVKTLINKLSILNEEQDKIPTSTQRVIDQLADKQEDPNGMLGQSRAFEVNTNGTSDIGSVANIIQSTSVLNQFNVKVLHKPYTFDDKTFDDYGVTHSLLGKSVVEGTDIIAQMDVDAVKEHLPSIFGLNAEFTTYIANIVRLGQDLETALLYPLTAPWIDYKQKVANSILEGGNKAKSILEDMQKDLKMRGAELVTLSTQKMEDYIKNGIADKDIEYTLLDHLEIMRDGAEPLRLISRLMRLDTGKGLISFEDIQLLQDALKDLGVGMSDEQFAKSGIPVDVRDIVTHKHGNMAANYQILQAIDRVLAPKFFLEKSAVYMKMTDMAKENFDVPSYDKTFNKQFKQDSISYLTLSAYMKTLRHQGKWEHLDSLNQNLIWDNADSAQSIVHIIKDLRSSLKGKDKNYLLNAFLNIVEKDAKSSINQVMGNSFVKLSEQMQSKLVGSFVDLVANSKGAIHKGAIALFNYLLVKDGGQFKAGSFIRYIPPFMLKEWSDTITKVTKVLSAAEVDEKTYTDLFGKSYEQLIEGMFSSYATHKSNVQYLRDYKQGTYNNYKLSIEVPQGLIERIGQTKTAPAYQNKDNQIVIDAFRGIREWQDMGNKGYLKKQGAFDDVEKELRKRNLSYIEAAGFTVKSGQVLFPFSIQQNGRLYKLQKIGREVSDTLTGLLGKGQDIPTGSTATYIPTIPDGDNKQWKAAKGVFGDYPRPGIKAPEPRTEVTTQPTTDQQAVQQLSERHGITKAVIGTKVQYYKDGQPWNKPQETSGMTAKELLQYLDKPVMNTQEPVVPSPEEVMKGLKDCGLL